MTAAPLPHPKRPMRAVWITAVLLALSVAPTLWFFWGMAGTSFSSNLLFLTLVNVNIALALILLLLLSRNLVKLYFERRQKMRGAGFKAKLVAAFLSLSLIPTLLLFGVASRLITRSIDHWFALPVEQALQQALSVGQDYYQSRQQAAIEDAVEHARLAEAQPDLVNDALVRAQFIAAAHRTDRSAQVYFLTPDGRPLDVIPSPPLPKAFLRRIAEGTRPVSTIQSAPDGDHILGGTAVRKAGEVTLLVVVDMLIPAPLVSKMEKVQVATEEYRQLAAFKTPIKGNYLLSFSIIVLLIIFAAVWFGVYLARSITVPIQALAEGTQAVAQGNLDVRIDVQATDELGSLVDSFNRMTADLRCSREALIRAEKIATWQEVAQQMAHEIKNPLTPIQLSTERLRKKYFDRAADFDRIFDDATRTIIHEVHGLKALVDAFAQFARIPPPTLARQKLDPIIEEVMSLYRTGYKDIQFSAQLDPAMPPLALDSDQIKRVFVNLFDNAVAAMASRGRLEVTSRFDKAARRIFVLVSDDGVGVAPDDFERLFLPDFSRKNGGSGLGLAIVYRTMRDHNGQITAAPRTPRGTTFTLEFPA